MGLAPAARTGMMNDWRERAWVSGWRPQGPVDHVTPSQGIGFIQLPLPGWLPAMQAFIPPLPFRVAWSSLVTQRLLMFKDRSVFWFQVGHALLWPLCFLFSFHLAFSAFLPLLAAWHARLLREAARKRLNVLCAHFWQLKACVSETRTSGTACRVERLLGVSYLIEFPVQLSFVHSYK